MMRITRQEEHFIGRARPGLQGRVKIGFRRDGRITAMDMFFVQDGGPYGMSGDYVVVPDQSTLMYQPLSHRFRGISVYTNTPPRSPQRAPGGLQAVSMFSPLMQKAAKKLGIDPLEMIRINAPAGQAKLGRPDENGEQGNVSSAFVVEAADLAEQTFDWQAMRARSGQRNGTRVTGVGVALSSFNAGAWGMDGLLTIRPDGKVYIQQGIGNLGTGSVFDTGRAAMEALKTDWDQAEVIWGDTSKHLPWSIVQAGSNTIHTHTRTNYAAGEDARRKLQEIAAGDLGGSPDDYDVADGRVFRRGARSSGLSFAQAARRAIELGGRFDGHELPEDINAVTTGAATALAGLGLMGVARDNYPTGGRVISHAIGFAEVEVDVETGAVVLKDYRVSTDVGTVINPRGLAAQLHGGGIQGFSAALGPEMGVRPPLGPAGVQAVLCEPPADHTRRAARAADGLGGAGQAGPVQPDGGQGCRRNGGRRRIGRGAVRDCRRAGRRILQPYAVAARPDPHQDRAIAPCVFHADGARVGASIGELTWP